MNKIKLILYILPFIIFISSCNTLINATQNKFAGKTSTNRSLSKDTFNRIKEDNGLNQSKQNFTIQELPDNNYGFCQDSALNKNIPNLEGWCFIFNKNNNHIIGLYTLWLPSDYARICIDGTIKNNIVTGIGYEIIEGDLKPITLQDVLRNAKNGIWDNFSIEEGNNLKVSIPSLYSTKKHSSEQQYAWIRYEKVQLDLNNFNMRNLGKTIPPKKCLN